MSKSPTALAKFGGGGDDHARSSGHHRRVHRLPGGQVLGGDAGRDRDLPAGPAPWFKRHRDNAQFKAFVQGATAATGAIAGAVVVLGLRSIYDIPTALIGLATFGLLWRFKLQEPIVVTAAGLAGLVIWPLVSGGR